LTLLTLQSCIVYNAVKHQDSNICGLHKEKMRKALVGTTYGRACAGNKADYKNAKRKKCMGCIIEAWPNRRLAVIYHCKSCNRIKKASGDKNENPF
jgi:hypothetical protein